MNEYIERKIAIKRVMETKWESGSDGAAAMEIVAATPAADVAPVVHGRWFYHDDGVITCSECGNAESSDSYYCRYCGAKMDGGADNA